MLYFVTSNKNKVARAEKYLHPLGIQFTPKDLPLDELQSHSIEKIAKDKAEKAFEILKSPLFVNDHGWSIPALNGFPGAYMKYINEWFTPDDFLRLLDGKNDREMIFTEYICYIDSKVTKTFSQTLKGHILYESKGKGVPWMTVSSFSDDGESIAQKLEHDPSAINEAEFSREFAEWLKNHIPVA